MEGGDKIEEPELEGDTAAGTKLVNGAWKLMYDVEAAYKRDVFRYKRLTSQEEEELLKRYLSVGDPNAFDRLVACNLRLVVSIAGHYARTYNAQFLDLVQEGSMGLMLAIKRFSLEKECKLGTYATWWIRQRIERHIMNTSRTIRIPVHVHTVLAKARKASHRLLQSFGREPTPEELSSEMGIPLKQLVAAQEGLKKIASTDAAISASDEDSDLLGDFLEDERPLSDEQLHNQELSEKVIRPALVKLKPQYRFVMVMRYGVEGVIFSQEEIVKVLNNHSRTIDLEDVREVEVSALRKLNPPNDILFDRRAATEWLHRVSREVLTLDEDTVFMLRYGIGARESSLEGVAARTKVTREYIRQTEARVLTRLKKYMERELLFNERKNGIYIEMDD